MTPSLCRRIVAGATGRGSALSALMMLAATVSLAQGPAGEKSAEAAKEAKGKWAALFRRQAEDYVLTGGADARAKAQMLSEPILRWWQPVRGTDDGAVFLWVRDGLPEAAGSVFTIKDVEGDRALVHEFHSLSRFPVEAQWRGGLAWDCRGPGLEPKPIPDAPAPLDSPQGRSRQLQDLAREFSANSVDRKGSPWELRLLSKPIYRYESKAPEVLDGAIFAFVQGTDPEILLLIEAAREGTKPRWRYALASFTDLELHARHRGREVWSTPLAIQLEGRSGPHLGFTVERRKGDDPDAFDRSRTP
jgi:hypothetical protein